MPSALKHAVRSLARAPGFSGVAILIVALGIGAATAMFSTVNALVLRPIALPEPDRLVAVYETNLARNQSLFSVSIPNYTDWKNRAHSWTSLAAMNWRGMNLTGNGEPEFVQVKAITANFLPTLGISTQLGRNFLDAEDRPGGARVAIISDRFWQRRFGAAPDIVGQILHFDGNPYTIVGVTAPGQPLPEDLEVAVPLAVDPAKENRTNQELEVFGRLKPGVTIEQAGAELKTIASQLWLEHPAFDRGWSTRLVPFAQEVVGESVRKSLYVLLAAVGQLLVLACANVSNLLLVRASARAYELAVRAALGASRAQVIRLIVTESLLVTAVGGILGVLISLWAVDSMHSLPLPRAGEISVDLRVLAIACAVTLLAGFLSGLGPALKASHAQPQEALKGRSPRSGHRSRLRDGMVVAQLGISLTLLVAATLLGRSFLQLLRVNPGFNPEHTVTLSLRPMSDAAQFYEKLTARISSLPHVVAAGTVNSLPLTGGNPSSTVYPIGASELPPGASIQPNRRLVDGGYFSAMEIPVLRGRTFAGLNPDEARRSVVVSAELARLLWGTTDPIGRRLNPGGGGGELTVIGVVGDVRVQQLRSEPSPAFYWSMHRFIYGPMHVVVRTTGEIEPLVSAIRGVVKEIDPTVPVFRVRTLDDLRANSLEQERLVLSLLAGFTAVALLLAALGTYGVIAFTVQQRTPEIGIRLALGAQARDILHLVIRHAAQIMVAGALVGLLGALATSRLLSAMLYKTGSTDASSYLLATVGLIIIALTAAILPARRAMKVDPLIALRSE